MAIIYKCDFCGQQFMNPKRYEDHLKRELKLRAKATYKKQVGKFALKNKGVKP